jgi:Phage integrase family
MLGVWDAKALRGRKKIQGRVRAFFGSDYHPEDYVFTFEDGRPPHPDTIRQRFDRVAAASGLSRITFHDLRHSYATAALKAGLNPKVVSDRIAHANVGFFLETYAHVLKKDDREAPEPAASFLLAPSCTPRRTASTRRDVHKSVHKWHRKQPPERDLRGAVSTSSGDSVVIQDMRMGCRKTSE